MTHGVTATRRRPATTKGTSSHQAYRPRRRYSVRETTNRDSAEGSLRRLSPTSQVASWSDWAASDRHPRPRRRADDAGLGVGRRVELGFPPAAACGVGVLTRLHPHHPHAGGRVQMEVDRAGLLDTPGGDGGHGVGVGVVPGLVGARLADDPPFVGGEEPAQGLAERGVGLEGPLGLGQRAKPSRTGRRDCRR